MGHDISIILILQTSHTEREIRCMQNVKLLECQSSTCIAYKQLVMRRNFPAVVKLTLSGYVQKKTPTIDLP